LARSVRRSAKLGASQLDAALKLEDERNYYPYKTEPPRY
jgi:hypothetical protein